METVKLDYLWTSECCAFCALHLLFCKFKTSGNIELHKSQIITFVQKLFSSTNFYMFFFRSLHKAVLKL